MGNLLNVFNKKLINIIKLTQIFFGLGILFSVVSCSHNLQHSIVGSWNEVGKPNSCVIFQKDGNLSSSTGIVGDFIMSGTYSITGNDEVTITLSQPLFGVQTINFKAHFENNFLILQDQRGSETLKLARSQC